MKQVKVVELVYKIGQVIKFGGRRCASSNYMLQFITMSAHSEGGGIFKNVGNGQNLTLELFQCIKPPRGTPTMV